LQLTHKDPSKSFFTKALHQCRDYKTAVKNGRAFEPYSYVERKTRAATRSTVAYGPHGSELVELAQLSHRGLDACQTMYTVLLERLGRSNQKWRNVAKGLDVLKYVLVRGSVEFVELVKRDPNIGQTLERLQGFVYVTSDAESRDVGAGVRQKAKDVGYLLQDEHALAEARAHGEIQSRKMAGSAVGVDAVVAPLPQPSQPSQPSQPPQVPPHSHARTLSADSVTSTKGVGEDENARHMEALKKLLLRAENTVCADCGLKSPRPSWASVNLGVYLCLRCAGIHRSLGVHVSQVRSCTLDVWTFEQLEVMARCGNIVANSYWECTLKDKPHMMTIGDVEKFVLSKYVEKAYVLHEATWPPDAACLEAEIEEVLMEAMDEERREAYFARKIGEEGSGGDSGKEGVHVQAATASEDLLISLMDEDPDVPVLVVEADATVEEKEDGFFEGLLERPAEVGTEEASRNDAVTAGHQREETYETDDLALLFSLADGSGHPETEVPGPLPPVEAIAEPTPVVHAHEKKALDLVTNLLEDFDVSSSIASSVSPKPRAKTGGKSTGSPMRAAG
jgi:hypothetical protein